MSVSDTTNRRSFTCNGTTTAFAWPAYVESSSDIKVVVVNRSANTFVMGTAGVDYNFTGAGEETGGTVTTVGTYGGSMSLVIYNEPSVVQDFEADPYGAFSSQAPSIETRLDRLTIIAQRVLSLSKDRSVRLGDDNLQSINLTFPADANVSAQLADKVPLFGTAGTSFASASLWPTGDDITNAQSYAGSASASAGSAATSASQALAAAGSAATSAAQAGSYAAQLNVGTATGVVQSTGGTLSTNATMSNGGVVFVNSNNQLSTSTAAGGGIYWDQTNARMGVGIAPTLNTVVIGATTYGAVLTVDGEGTSDALGLSNHRHSSVAAVGANTVYARSRGTNGTPTAVQVGDRISRVLFVGHDGTDYEYAGYLECMVDGTPSANNVPGRLSFAVTGTAQTASEAFRIASNKQPSFYYFGSAGVLFTDASGTLTHTGTIARSQIAAGSANAVVVNGTGGSLGEVAPGASGTFLTSNGTTWQAGTPGQVINDQSIGLSNIAISASVSGGALFLNLVGTDGGTHSSGNPGYVWIRNGTATNGIPSPLQITTKLALTVSSNATLGMTSSVQADQVFYITNNAGTPGVAIITGEVDEGSLQNVTPIGTASDSAAILYGAATLSSVPVRKVARIRSTQAAAGNWATAPSELAVIAFDSYPEDMVVLEGQNGWGTTSTAIRRYSTATTTGTAMTITQDAANGDSVTINKDGIYYISRIDEYNLGGYCVGLSVNANTAANGTTACYMLSDTSKILDYEIFIVANYMAKAVGGFRLKSGDIVRPHDELGCTQKGSPIGPIRMKITRIK